MLFKQLRGFFEKKKRTTRTEKQQISADDAAEIILKIKENEEKKLLEELSRKKKDIFNSLKNMEKAFEELRAVTPEEPRAQASKAIKDSFSGKALELIRNFHERIESDDSLLRIMRSRSQGDDRFAVMRPDDYEHFAADCNKLVQMITISPKEAMHLKFFFEEEMKGIAASVKNFSGIANEISSKIRAHAQRFSDAMNITENIKKLEDKLKEKTLDAEKTENDANRMEKEAAESLSKIRKVDGMEGAKLSIKNEESSLKMVEEQLDSRIFSVSKILRKYAYGIASKEEKALIEKYFSSPKIAVLDDENLEIFQMVRKSLDNRKDIGLSEKECEKASSFPDKEELLSIRNKIIELAGRISELKREAAPLEEAEKRNREITRRADEMKSGAEFLRNEAGRMRNEIENDAKRREELKTSLIKEAGRLAGNR